MARMTGTDEGTYTTERSGMSAIALEDGFVHRTYSRGMDPLWSMYQWLDRGFDRAPKRRNEKGFWWRRHNEYNQPAA
jgi:predicted dithiol-disulfide oxidoreductase (DUF899 family)